MKTITQFLIGVAVMFGAIVAYPGEQEQKPAESHGFWHATPQEIDKPCEYYYERMDLWIEATVCNFSDGGAPGGDDTLLYYYKLWAECCTGTVCKAKEYEIVGDTIVEGCPEDVNNCNTGVVLINYEPQTDCATFAVTLVRQEDHYVGVNEDCEGAWGPCYEHPEENNFSTGPRVIGNAGAFSTPTLLEPLLCALAEAHGQVIDSNHCEFWTNIEDDPFSDCKCMGQ